MQIAGRDVSLAEILHMIKVMGQCVDEMRWNDNPRLVLELYSLRLTQPFVDAGALLRRLEQLEKHGPTPLSLSSSSPAVSGGGPIAPSTLQDGSRPTIRRDDVKNDHRTVGPPANPPVTPDIAALWKQFIAELWKKPMLASHMERAHLKAATAVEWVIGFEDAFAMASVQRNQAFVEEMAAMAAGLPIKVRFVQQPADRREGEEATIVVSAVADEKRKIAVQDVRVQKVLDVFKGKIREPIVMSSSLEQLRQRLALLPGVGPKMAERLALHLLRAPEHEVQYLIRSLEDARRQVLYCPICLTYTEETPCRICADVTRDPQVICVRGESARRGGD